MAHVLGEELEKAAHHLYGRSHVLSPDRLRRVVAMPSWHRTKSIATLVSAAICAASWPAPLGSL